jgi:hypothetical protein
LAVIFWQNNRPQLDWYVHDLGHGQLAVLTSFSLDFNMTLQGSKRKVTYVASYEAIAFLFGTLGFLSFTDSSLERAGALAVFASIFAVSWNFVYNAMFERWEASRITRGRNFSRRGCTRWALSSAFWWCSCQWQLGGLTSAICVLSCSI